MCGETNCPSKRTCYRHHESGTLPSQYWQSYGGHPDIDPSTGHCASYDNVGGQGTMEEALHRAVSTLVLVHNHYRQKCEGDAEKGYKDALVYCEGCLIDVISCTDPVAESVEQRLMDFLNQDVELSVVQGMKTHAQGYKTGLNEVILGVAVIMSCNDDCICDWGDAIVGQLQTGEQYA